MTTDHPSKSGLTYRDAGVDIVAANRFVESISSLIKLTTRPECIDLPNGFAALFEIPGGFDSPVLVSATDGVGTKVKIAIEMNRFDTIGIDLVAMCVNDIVVHGAEPLYFLDYIAAGKLDVEVSQEIVKGIVKGCRIASAALVGGETAEMPNMYRDGEFDIAGFAVGIVEKSKIIDGRRMAAGDIVLGIESSGVHSNGFSLIRKIVDDRQISLASKIGDNSLGELFLTPTRIYSPVIVDLLSETRVSAMAHITGGGLSENMSRVVPDGLSVQIESGSWDRHEIFTWIEENGSVAPQEMLSTFNCGIGYVVIAPEADLLSVKKVLNRHEFKYWEIGRVTAADNGQKVYIDGK